MPAHSNSTNSTSDELKKQIKTSEETMESKNNENMGLLYRISSQNLEFAKSSREINELIQRSEALIAQKKLQSQFATMLIDQKQKQSKSHSCSCSSHVAPAQASGSSQNDPIDLEQTGESEEENVPDEENNVPVDPAKLLLLYYFGNPNVDPALECTTCSICYSDTTPMSSFITFCNHQFHQKCIYDWFYTAANSTCANCRHEVDLPDHSSFFELEYVMVTRGLIEPAPMVDTERERNPTPDPRLFELDHSELYGFSPSYEPSE